MTYGRVESSELVGTTTFVSSPEDSGDGILISLLASAFQRFAWALGQAVVASMFAHRSASLATGSSPRLSLSLSPRPSVPPCPVRDRRSPTSNPHAKQKANFRPASRPILVYT